MSGFRWIFNVLVENPGELINHSTVLTRVSTVFTVENVENFSLICTKNTAAKK